MTHSPTKPKITVSRLVRPLDLTGYAPELVDEAGQRELIHVWVNPTRDVLNQHAALLGEAAARLKAKPAKTQSTKAKRAADDTHLQASNLAMATWYATVWSQHADPATHWTAGQVLALANLDTDPGLFVWLTRQTWQMITEHRNR